MAHRSLLWHLLLISFHMRELIVSFRFEQKRSRQHCNYWRCQRYEQQSHSLLLKASVEVLEVAEELEDDYKQRFNNVARLYPDSVDSTLHKLRDARVLVVGLGGVGSWVVEALARSGIGSFTLIDMDDICISNTNRQIQALTSSVGKFKAESLRDRILDINPYAHVEVLLDFLRPTNVDAIIATNVPPTKLTTEPGSDEQQDQSGEEEVKGEEEEEEEKEEDTEPYELSGPPRFDFVIDAADGVTDKVYMIDACVRSGTPIVVSGGAGGLTDPSLLRISDITAAVGDKLIMQVRKKLRQKFGYPQGAQMSSKDAKVKIWNIAAVHTLPTGQVRGVPNADAAEGNFRKCDMAFGNACFATGAAGFMMASVVVNSIAGLGLALSSTPTGLKAKKKVKGGERGLVPRALGVVGRRRGAVPSRRARAVGSNDGEVALVEGVRVRGQEGKGAKESAPADESCSCGAGAGTGVGGSGTGTGSGSSSGKRDAVSPTEDPRAVLSELAEECVRAGLRADTAVVDAHCHLQLDPLYTRASSGEVRAAAAAAGVSMVVVCGTCPGADWQRVRELHAADPAFVRPQYGLHPWWIQRHLDGGGDVGAEAGAGGEEGAGAGWEQELDEWIRGCAAAGVGECGLDKAIAKAVSMDRQYDILRRHMAVAARHRRPVTLHCVGAWGRLLDAIRASEVDNASDSSTHAGSTAKVSVDAAADADSSSARDSSDVDASRDTDTTSVRGVRAYVLHSCNSMPPEMARDFAAISNVYFSFTGRALGAKESRIARAVPLSRLLLETDSPDQLHGSLRGRLACNEPALVRHSCVLLAGVLGVDPNELAMATAANARRVFDV